MGDIVFSLSAQRMWCQRPSLGSGDASSPGGRRAWSPSRTARMFGHARAQRSKGDAVSPQVAIVAGASGALGHAITKSLAVSGLTVVAVDRTERGLREIPDGVRREVAARPPHRREVHRRAGLRGYRGLHLDHRVRPHAIVAPRSRARRQQTDSPLNTAHRGRPSAGSGAALAKRPWTLGCLQCRLAIFPCREPCPRSLACAGPGTTTCRTSMLTCRCGGRSRWSACPDRARHRWPWARCTPRACSGSWTA